MREANSAVELGVAGHALLDAWHADQDKADVVAVEDVTQVLQRGSVEALRFIKDHPLYIFPRHCATRCALMLIDADVDAAEQFVYLVSKRTEVGSDIRREEEDSRPG